MLSGYGRDILAKDYSEKSHTLLLGAMDHFPRFRDFGTGHSVY